MPLKHNGDKDMRRFSITLAHDNGFVCFHTTSSNWQTALRSVLSFEYAPTSSVVSVEDWGMVA